MNIHISIERLILVGLPVEPGQRGQLQAAVEQELGRLFASGALSPTLSRGGALPTVAVAPIQLANGASPAHLGAQIAQSLHNGLGGEQPS